MSDRELDFNIVLNSANLEEFTTRLDAFQRAWWAQDVPKCHLCGSTDPRLTIGWPVCLNDDFHEENTPYVPLWRRVLRWFGVHQ